MTDESVNVKVLFVKSDGEIVAVFPYVPGTNNALTMTCYAHIGQHSSCHAMWVNEQKKANESEYESLLQELKSIGYNVEVLKRYDALSYMARKAEIDRINGIEVVEFFNEEK